MRRLLSSGLRERRQSLSLRFEEEGMEMAFVLERKVSLVRRSMAVAALAACVVVVLVVDSLLPCEGEGTSQCMPLEDVASQALRTIHLCQLCTRVALFAILVLCLVLLRCGNLVDRLGPFQLEVYSTALTTCVMLVLVLTSHENILRLMGHGREVHVDVHCTSDCTSVLTIDAAITLAHVGLPVRWRALLPMEVAGVVLYSAVTFSFSSCEHQRFYNLFCLLGLVIASAIGKRTVERFERRLFEVVSPWCDADGKLSFSAELACVNVGHQDSGRSSSQPSNTPSFGVFDIEETDDAFMQLSRIAELGLTEHWCINPKEVRVLPKLALGEGSYGKVVQGVFCGMLVAVKQPRERPGRSWNLPNVCNELRILRRLRHPNIVSTYGAVIDPEERRIDLVFELVKGVSLDKFMIRKADRGEDRPDRSPYVRYKLMLEVCRALMYLHSRDPRIVHGDLKSANIMVEGSQNADFSAKLLDFGLSRVRTGGAAPLGGTLAWMAPEVACRSRQVKCSADIYSFGRVVAFLATGIPPMAGMRANNVKQLLRTGRPPPSAWPAGCVFYQPCKALVESCLVPEEADRPSINSVHRELLELPEKLGLQSADNVFLEEVQTLSAHLGSRPAFDSEEREVEEALRTVPEAPDEALEAAAQADESHMPGELTTQMDYDPQTGEPQTREPQAVEPQAGEPGRRTKLVLPDKLPTAFEVMTLSICEAISSWNCEVPEASCCAIHANARVARRVCTSLINRPCFSDDVMNCGAQCLRCGLLGLELPAADCELCRGVPLGPQAPHARSVRVGL